MSIFNRRNAAFGWLAWALTKTAVKHYAKTSAVPRIDRKTKRPNRVAIALLIAGAVGIATFWRRRSGDGDAFE